MHEQRGSFQRIDTCDVMDVGNFSFPFVLLDKSESRTILNRTDTNALLGKLQREEVLIADTVIARLQRVGDLYQDPSFLSRIIMDLHIFLRGRNTDTKGILY